MQVKSNNGWFAVVETSTAGRSSGVSGIGRWDALRGGAYSQKPFQIPFILTGSHLYMRMTVPEEGRAPRVVRAIFERLPAHAKDRNPVMGI